MIGQFVGYVDARTLPNGLMQLVRVTDFSNPICNHKASNIATRMPETQAQGQVFVVNSREFNALHSEVGG